MTKRTYNQFCPLAYSLDVIGERWTLLIIREMMFGPRRFKDLINGLPGIGTNLLATRLKELEAVGIIAQETLPPPAGSHVYVLTEWGSGLREIIGMIAQWGWGFIQLPPPEEDYLSVPAVMGATFMLFDATAATHTTISCEVHCSGEIFTVAIQDGMLNVTQGTLPAPDIIVQLHPKGYLNLLGHALTIDETTLDLRKGNPAEFENFLKLFREPQANLFQA